MNQATLYIPQFEHAQTAFVWELRTVNRAGFVPAGRKLHLIDIENLMGGPFVGPSAMLFAFEQYRTLAPIGAHDHVVTAANPNLIFECPGVIARGQYLSGPGPNGADLALIRQLREPESIAARYDEVIMGSGDGIFALPAARLKRLGLTVGVIGLDGCISRQLARTATYVRRIHLPNPMEAA